MWIREVLTDPPRGARTIIVTAWVRTLLLAIAAVCAGNLTISLAGGQVGLASLIVGLTAVILAALAGAISEAVPSRIQSREESAWRGKVLASAMAGTVATPKRRGPPVSADGAVLDAAMLGAEKTAGYRAVFLGPTLASFTSPLLVLLVWAIAIDWLSALVLALFIGLVPVIIMTAGKLLRTSNHEYRMKETQATNRYVEMIEGIGTLKVLGAAGRAREEFATSARASMDSLGRLLARNQRMIISNDLVFGFFMTGIGLALVLMRVSSGAITAAGGISAILLLVLLHEPIDRVGRTFYIGLGGRARRDQLNEMIGEARPIRDVTAPESAEYRLDNVSVSLSGQPILTDISLDIPAGTHVAIVGPTGAGKTTLLKVLAGLIVAGGVALNGRPASATDLREAATLVSQRAGILSTTIRDNLAFSEEVSEKEMVAALAQAHLDLAEFPQGLDTPVGQSGAFLSGGQRRRLILARAILRPRPALLLDEATADLDRRTESLVRKELSIMSRGRTVIQVAHRLDMIAEADQVVVIEGGRITQVGSPEALADQPGYYASALGVEVTRG